MLIASTVTTVMERFVSSWTGLVATNVKAAHLANGACFAHWDKNEKQQLRSLNDSTNNYEPTTQTLLPKYIHKLQYILFNSSEDVLISLLAYMVAFVLF